MDKERREVATRLHFAAAGLLEDYFQARTTYLAAARTIFARSDSMDAAIQIGSPLLDEATAATDAVMELLEFALTYKTWVEAKP